MDKRTTGIIATIASVLLCGCPGIFLCIFGIAAAVGGGTLTLGDTTQPMPPSYGYVSLCLSLIFIVIPIVIGIVTLRKKPEEAAPVADPVSAPRPPASSVETVLSSPKPRVPPVDDERLPPAS
jgi:hypothetical protein